MSGPCRIALTISLCIPVFAFAQQAVPTGAAAASQTGAATGQTLGNGMGTVHLDVLVTDSSGRPVSGLTRQDFTLLDDKQPRPIASFQAFDGTGPKPERPVQVILLIDTLNAPVSQVAQERDAVATFLQQNGGHLALPTSIFILSETGVKVQPVPSMDGAALTAELKNIETGLRSIHRSAGLQGALERLQLSVRALEGIANAENVPGRKLLIWAGSGWPMINGLASTQETDKDKQKIFNSIVAMSTKLRQSGITLYSISNETASMGSSFYETFLKPVPTYRQALLANLAMKVLVVQSGGRVLGPDNNLVKQIDTVVQDAGAYYTLSFDPPKADKPNEYHDLDVQVAKPGLSIRTRTGYYNQP